MCIRLAINSIHKRFNCSGDYWFDSIEEKSTEQVKSQLLIPWVNIVFLKLNMVDGWNFIKKSQESNQKSRIMEIYLNWKLGFWKLATFGKFNVNEQLLSWSLFSMIKTPN